MEIAKQKEINKSKYQRILEKGLKDRMIFLFEKGFINVKDNLKYLLENNKDQEKTLEALILRNKAKIEKTLKTLDLWEKGEQKVFSSEERDLKRKEKQDKREQRKKTNEDKKSGSFKEKKENREKSQRKDKSEKRERKEYIDKEKLKTEIQSGLVTLVLDGNNLLFADDVIRKLVLKGKRKEAEKKLIHLALQYSKAAGIEELTVLYDMTKLSYDWSKVGSDDKLVKKGIVNETNKLIKLRVSSAIPQFSNSDDALVAMSGNFSKDELARKLFITSDRELMKRLDDVGSQVMKTGVWFKLAKAKLGEQYDSILTK
jgi:hypothetical protein